jgi:hypothetical protein
MLSARVAPAQRIDVEKRMGNVATAAAGNAYFGKQLACFFKQGYLQIFIQSCGRYRTKEPRCTTAYNDQLFQNPMLFRERHRHVDFII